MAVADALRWLDKLYGELGARQSRMQLMDDYYSGEHPLPFLTKAHADKMLSEFRMMLEDSRSNFMRLVVDVVEERMQVEGFRLSASTDEQADKRSWEIWQANQMDAESQSAFVEALVKGVSYMSVWAGQGDDAMPTIAVEDPLQTIVGYVPGSNYRKRAAALKVWRDDWTGDDRANVYLPNGIYKFLAKADKEKDPAKATATGPEDTFGVTNPEGSQMTDHLVAVNAGGRKWEELENSFVANPIGVVPIVPIRNRPRLLSEGESELADVYRTQNQINGLVFLLALAGYFGAHRQRWAIGIKLIDDEQGRPQEPFDMAIDRLLTSENPNAKFGDFSETNLDGYIKSIEQKVLHIAVTTRTPRHYLIQEGQSPSGDAIKTAESGLVKKARRKMRPFGEGLEETIRLARRFAGEKDAPVDSEIVWADPEVRTEAEITDAAIKKFQAKLITRSQTLEDIGYSQTQIARMIAAPDSELADDPAPNPDPEPVPV